MEIAAGTRKLVDSRGSPCPGPITDLAMAHRRAKAGDIIELWATDPGVKADVQAWAGKNGDQILSIHEQGDKIVVVLKIVRR